MKPETNCEDLLQHLWAYLDEEVPGEHRAAFDAHIRACAHCFRAVEFERAFLSALHTARRAPDLRETLRQRLTALVRQEGGAAPPTGGTTVTRAG